MSKNQNKTFFCLRYYVYISIFFQGILFCFFFWGEKVSDHFCRIHAQVRGTKIDKNIIKLTKKIKHNISKVFFLICIE